MADADDTSGARRLWWWLAGIGFVGVVLAMAFSVSIESRRWNGWVPVDAAREIGGALVAGAVIGAVLHAMAETAERRRERRERQLHDESMDRAEQAEAADRRHRLAVELAVRGDLSGLVLAGHDLQGIVLSRRDLRNVDLSRADLTKADLSGANLTNAQLYGATLENADLFMANLTGANLASANLSGADVGGATFTDAELSLASFTGLRWLPNRPPSWPEGYELPTNSWDGDESGGLASLDLRFQIPEAAHPQEQA